MNCDTFGHPERLAAALGLLWHSLPALVASFAVTVAVVPVARAVAHRTGEPSRSTLLPLLSISSCCKNAGKRESRSV